MHTRISSRASGEIDSAANTAATIEAVLSDIAIAVSHVSAAESAFATGKFGATGELHLRAEQHLTAILRKICNLTDAEAVSVESRFTEFEERLIGLRSALLKRSTR